MRLFLCLLNPQETIDVTGSIKCEIQAACVHIEYSDGRLIEFPIHRVERVERCQPPATE